MKNIFILTKAEQRAVIVILMALLAATIARRFLEDRAHIPAPTSTAVRSPPLAYPSENEAEPETSPR